MKPKLRVVSITQLVLDEKNANKGTKRGRELLGDSLEKYGAGRSVVVDRYNRVIAGNKTVEAAVAAGMKSIAVIETDGSSLVAVQRGDLDLKKDTRVRLTSAARTYWTTNRVEPHLCGKRLAANLRRGSQSESINRSATRRETVVQRVRRAP